MGTSYGGYSTVYTMEMYPDIFTAGVANSAVADWKLYDTIYTERYMGLLGDNKAGYESSSAIANAGKLQGHLLRHPLACWTTMCIRRTPCSC